MTKVTKQALIGWGHELAAPFLAVGILYCGAAFAAATTNEGGEYTYTGSPNDNRTTGQTGDQIWNVASPLTIGSFFPGQSDSVPYWQIYRGAAITVTGNCRVMQGNVVFENAVKWTGTENYIGHIAPTKLILRNGGSLTTTTEHLRIGQKHSSYPNSTATLFMEEPSLLSVNVGNAIAGNDRPGAIWMDGGTLAVSNGVFKTGGTASQDGYIRINGGVVSLGAGEADFFSIGSGANYGSLHISGGTVSSRTTIVPGNPYAHLGVGSSKAADIYVDGGLFDLWNERIDIGYWGSGTTGARATLTVDGDGRVVMYLPIMGRSGSGNKATVNLNGGRFALTRGFTTYGNTGNSRGVNFDGGTLALVKHSKTTDVNGKLDSAAGDIVVYPKGGSIEVPLGITGVVSTSFRKATGYGVSEITLTNPGSGYVTTPEVKITGGSGSGATAYAILNKDRTLEKIVVTCRGEGYAANDSVTVTISSATGSGAAASATLASNAGGVIRKTGAGAWQQQTNDNSFDGEIEITEGLLKLNGKGLPSASLNIRPGASLLPIKGTAPSLGCLAVTNGIAEIRADGSSGTATLTIGALSVNQGLALVTYTNGLGLVLTATDSTATSSSASPVVNGLVYANKDRPSNEYRTPSLYERAADGSLSLVTTSTTPGADVNWRPSASISEADAPEVSAVNSIIMPLTPTVECYVKNTGLVDVKSGMIVVQRPQQDCQRMQVTGGGAFTTRAKGGMFIYADNKEIGKRSYSEANNKVVFAGNWRRLFGPFADPDSSTPMSLTVAGAKEARPELGAQAWLLGVQTFSGGLNLVNGGVFIQADSGLGASGSPVRASGYCSVSAYNWTFDISHPIELLDGSALIFSPIYGNGGNTISSTLSGSGDLLTSDVNRPGYAMAYTGDHSAFTGDYYIQGHARIAPSVFSELAGIKLADGTNGVGVIETSGSFTCPADTGKGAVCWKRFAAYPASYGLRGGFAARGGELEVNLGGENEKLVVGADYLPDGTIVQLQSQHADGALTFMNGFELNGKTQKVNVWSGKTATFAGSLSDAVGGGALAVTGNLALDGATFEIAPANLSAPMLTVDGALALDGTLNIALDPTCVEGREEITLATATRGVSGTPVAAGNIPSQWMLLARTNSLVLKKIKGTMLLVR